MALTIIGDVHGKIDQYISLTQQFPYTVQVGDLGFDYDFLQSVDSTHHKWYPGNHDNFDRLDETIKSGHCLGRFGVKVLNSLSFFYISGGFSIDWKARTPGKDFFFNEELSLEEMQRCKNTYNWAKPGIVLSHECPYSVSQILFPNRTMLRDWGYGDNWRSQTQDFLEELFILHQPKLWIFGHFHSGRDRVIDGTRFICLPELGTFTIGD